MQLFGSLSLVLSLALSAVSLVSADSHQNARRHSVMKRNPNDTSLSKRFSDARFTYYAAGLGACGKTNSASDFIVAMNSGQFSGGSHCFDTITISFGGKSTQAQVMDECPGCPYGGLDFSEGLFKYFSSLDAGVLTGSWVFGSGGGGGGDDTPTTTHHKTTSTSTWEAPKTTWTPKTTSTTEEKKTTEKKTSTWSATTTSTTSTSTSSKISTTSTTPTSTNTTAAPSTTDPTVVSAGSLQDTDGAINQHYVAIMGIAGLLSKALTAA